MKFFEDICTIKEFRDLHRLEVARLLTNGKVFNEINKVNWCKLPLRLRGQQMLVCTERGWVQKLYWIKIIILKKTEIQKNINSHEQIYKRIIQGFPSHTPGGSPRIGNISSST